MAPNERARKSHGELFPGHVSTLAVTDPELIEIFDNFAFDEVLRHGNLDARTRLMVQLAAMIACQALREYRVMLGAALAVGVTPVEIKEIVYQAVPYVGMAKVFDFIHATNDVLTERGVALPLPGQSTTTPENRAEKGLAVQKQIIGSDAVENIYASRVTAVAVRAADDVHPALPEFGHTSRSCALRRPCRRLVCAVAGPVVEMSTTAGSTSRPSATSERASACQACRRCRSFNDAIPPNQCSNFAASMGIS